MCPSIIIYMALIVLSMIFKMFKSPQLRLTMTILMAFVSQAAIAQKMDSLTITKKEIKTFLNETRSLLSHKPISRLSSVPHTTLSRRFLEHLAEIDSVFSEADVEFIMRQITQTKDIVWDSSLFDSTTFIRAGDSRKIDRFSLSIPYFSIDRQACILKIGHYCGKLCGEGRLLILKRQNGKWRLYKTLGRWVS